MNEQSKTLLHEIVEQSPELAPSTRDRYSRDLNAWVAYAGPYPDGWTRKRAQDFYRQLIIKGLRPQSANRVIASIRYAAKWWAIRENDPDLDFTIIQKHKKHEIIPKFALSADQAIQLIGGPPDPNLPSYPEDLRNRMIFVVGLETGMRRMSLISMTLKHTLIDGQSHTGYPVAMVLAKGRSDERVPVPLSDAAVAAIRPWRDWLTTQGYGSRGPQTGPLVRALVKVRHNMGVHLEASQKEDGISPSALQKDIRARGQAIGIAGLHPHTFRRTFITWRSQAGLSPYEVAAITGHALKGLGAMGGYIDMIQIGGRVRNSTPEWLKQLMGV